VPPWLHVSIATAGSLAGAFFALDWAIDHPNALAAQGIDSGVLCTAALVLGGTTPMLVARFLIPARCPKCGQDARMKLTKPISYHCRHCGHVYETVVS
jgi:hypothetical protein